MLQSIYVALAAVNPHHLAQAIFVLNAALLAALATLKIQFAKTITLGNSLSNAIQVPVQSVLHPIVQSLLPEELKDWGTFFIAISVKFCAISIAWSLRKAFASIHSAIRGGLMFSKNLLLYLEHRSYLKPPLTYSNPVIFYGLGYMIAIIGLRFQFIYRHALPFPLNAFLFPLVLVENGLMWLVNNSSFLFHNM